MRSLPEIGAAGLHSQNLATLLRELPVRRNEQARAYARRALLDTLGAALAGTTSPEFYIASRAMAEGAGGIAPVWGTDLSISPSQAALLNGTASHAFEVDDFGGCGHSGAVVVPAVLAAASRRDVSGPALIDAILVGYEAAARVTDAMGGYPIHNAAGWHSTGTCGSFGAAAAAARLLDLGADRYAHALALAGTFTGGTWSFMPNGAMNKRLHAGKAAEAGITAALLAAEGFTGPLHLFEPVWGGFVELYAAGSGVADALTTVHPDLLIYRSGIKPYACCRGCHSSLDVILGARTEHGFSGGDVEKVDIFGSDQTVRQLGKQRVETVLDAQMSLPYSVAVALIHGSGELRYYQPPSLDDHKLVDLAARVTVHAEDVDSAAHEPRLEILLRDGRRFEGRVEVAKGAASNPLSEREVEEKFMNLSGMAISARRAAAIAEWIAAVETMPSVAPLLGLLAKEGSQ